MRLSEKYRPRILSDIVGQPPVRLLKALADKPYACCVLLEGGPGTGKTTAARALAHELGCFDDFSGLYEITSTELTIDRCRELFDISLRLRPLEGSGWRVLVIEEFEAASSVAVQRYLKVALESKLPQRCIVVATSNGAGAIEKALLQRFRVYAFSSGPYFAAAAAERVAEIWDHEAGGSPLPADRQTWGWSGEEFSLRLALDAMQDSLVLAGVGA